jgi:hypothetical protein
MSSNRRSLTFPAASSLVRAAALWGILWTFGCNRSSSDGDVTEPLLVDPPALSFQRTDGDTDRRTATLQLRNVGRTPLRIVGVETTCGCTVVDELPQRPIPVRGEVTLKVNVSLPDGGTKNTRLAIDYAGAASGRVVVPLELHGRRPNLPFARFRETGISLPITDRSQPVVRRLAIETVEQAGEPPVDCRTPTAGWLVDGSPARRTRSAAGRFGPGHSQVSSGDHGQALRRGRR